MQGWRNILEKRKGFFFFLYWVQDLFGSSEYILKVPMYLYSKVLIKKKKNPNVFCHSYYLFYNWSYILSSGLCCKLWLWSTVFLLWPASVRMSQVTKAFSKMLCLSALELVRIIPFSLHHTVTSWATHTASIAVWSHFWLQHSCLSSVCNHQLTGTTTASNKIQISSFYYKVT